MRPLGRFKFECRPQAAITGLNTLRLGFDAEVAVNIFGRAKKRHQSVPARLLMSDSLACRVIPLAKLLWLAPGHRGTSSRVLQRDGAFLHDHQ